MYLSAALNNKPLMPDSWPTASLEQPSPETLRKFWPPKFVQVLKSRNVSTLVMLLPGAKVMACTGKVWLAVAGML